MQNVYRSCTKLKGVVFLNGFDYVVILRQDAIVHSLIPLFHISKAGITLDDRW
jgi:hypothetical protein